MKKVFSILMVAFAMTAMVACDKEDNGDNSNNNNGGGGGTVIDTDNMAQVGDLNTPLESTLEFSDYGEAAFHGMYANENAHVHFGAGIAWESLGKTFDLTSGHPGEDFWFRYEGWAEDGCEFTHNNYLDGSIACWLNQGEQMSDPVFASGTLSTTRTDEGYTLVIDGTLTDGTTVLIKMKVAYTDEVIPLTPNSVIYDGVKYEFTTTATQNAGTGDVSWTSTGDNNVSSSGIVYQGSNNLHIYLYENPTGGGYYFDFEVDVPGLELSYNWTNDHLSGTLNGEPFSSTPFTDGDAEIGAYYNEMRVTVIGTLSNGKVLKLYVASNY